MASHYCEHKDGCGNLLDDSNSVCAYYRKDGTMVAKKICKDLGIPEPGIADEEGEPSDAADSR